MYDDLDDILTQNENLPVTSSGTPVDWPPKLAFDLALGDSHESVISRYGLTVYELNQIMANPAFQREMAKHAKEILDNGISFKLKAKIAAEVYLEDINELIRDPAVAPSVKLDAIKTVGKWAGYEPKAEPASATNNIQINNKIAFCWADNVPMVSE